MPPQRPSTRQSPTDRSGNDAAPPWAIPIAMIGQTRLSISYIIFVAAAIVLTVVLIARGQPGNGDLPRAAMVGAAFWVAGWIVQATATLAIAWAAGISVRSLTVGLIGVESSPRRWIASKALLVSLGTVASLLVVAIAFRLIEGGGRWPVIRGDALWWQVPSLGTTAVDSMWRSAAWLFGLQAIAQMYPLPRTLGRQAYAAIVHLCAGRLDVPGQATLFRRCLIAVAIVTLGGAIAVLSTQSSDRFPQWPLLFFLSVMLWVSSHRSDVRASLQAFQSTGFLHARGQPHDSLDDAPGIVRRWRERVQGQRRNQRIADAMQRERDEAVDASRLDDILERLHSNGRDSLSDEDKKILARVSENLRKMRGE